MAFSRNSTIAPFVIQTFRGAFYTIAHVLAEVLKRGRFALCQLSGSKYICISYTVIQYPSKRATISNSPVVQYPLEIPTKIQVHCKRYPVE